MTQQAAVAKKPASAITPTRADDFPGWYQEVIKQADLAENSAVRGCMVIKPNGFAIWEQVQQILGGMIKKAGVRNAYFPLLIPLSYLSKEAEHVDGFATECAVVTHHRLVKGADGKLVPAADAQLPEPLIIRPTSETIIGEALSGWISSYRDLPYKLNQWCNVMRWEMRPRIFLRTAEFLWQEGHNCFETAEEARADALKMLGVYEDFLTNTMAIPTYAGEKTPDERFPGAIATYTLEAMMQDGKALQSCTSHDLGQTFSKSANIRFQGRDGQLHHAYTTSWGLSTRVLGALIMAHGDDDGLILPPNIAPTQVCIIPITREDSDINAIMASCRQLQAKLEAAGINATVDARDERTPTKMWDAIKQGIPVRAEIGGREAANNQVTFVRRDLGKPSSRTCSTAEFVGTLPSILKEMQQNLLQAARTRSDSRITNIKTSADLEALFAAEHAGFARAPISILSEDNFGTVRKNYSLTPRCLPFTDNGQFVLIGKSY